MCAIRIDNGAVRRHPGVSYAVPRDCCCDPIVLQQNCGGLSVGSGCGAASQEAGENQALFYEERMCLRSLVWVGAMYTGEFPNYEWDNFPKEEGWVEPHYVFRHAAHRREGCWPRSGSIPTMICRECCYIPYRPALWDCVDFNLVGPQPKYAPRRITEDDADYDLECGGDPNFLIAGDYFEQLVELMGDTYSGVPFTLFFTFTSSKWKLVQFADGVRTGNTYLNNKGIGGFLGYMIDANWDEQGYQYVGVDAGYAGPICPPQPAEGESFSCPED